MKRQDYGLSLGKLVHQLPRDVTLAYDLRLMHSIPRLIQLLGEQHQSIIHVVPRFPKKHCLRPQNGSRSLGPKKLLKIVNCAETEKLKEAMVGVQVE
jgi:hypothetical protein